MTPEATTLDVRVWSYIRQEWHRPEAPTLLPIAPLTEQVADLLAWGYAVKLTTVRRPGALGRG